MRKRRQRRLPGRRRAGPRRRGHWAETLPSVRSVHLGFPVLLRSTRGLGRGSAGLEGRNGPDCDDGGLVLGEKTRRRPQFRRPRRDPRTCAAPFLALGAPVQADSTTSKAVYPAYTQAREARAPSEPELTRRVPALGAPARIRQARLHRGVPEGAARPCRVHRRAAARDCARCHPRRGPQSAARARMEPSGSGRITFAPICGRPNARNRVPIESRPNPDILVTTSADGAPRLNAWTIRCLRPPGHNGIEGD